MGLAGRAVTELVGAEKFWYRGTKVRKLMEMNYWTNLLHDASAERPR